MSPTDISAIAGTVAALFAIYWGLYQYSRNWRLERARWLASLYEKFYEKENLKKIRQTLDREGNLQKLKDLVSDEPAEFTDYLNFFEFVAILANSKQLKPNEIEDGFGYYLNRLEDNSDVRDYISKSGYERLDKLLRDRAKVR
jgi:hypothetical protein